MAEHSEKASHIYTRRAALGLMGALPIAIGLAGCASGSGSASGASSSVASSASTTSTAPASASSASASASSAASDMSKFPKVVVGTLATEDILPLWVAEQEGLFAKHGVNAEIVVFQSATELIAGVSSGQVDMAMTDIMVSASLAASGTLVRYEWITLGTTPDQGRFGIMTAADSDIHSLTDLAGVPIGVGSNTILEYVMDRLLEDAGVPADQILVEEIQKLPVRYQAMAAGEVAAAALPGALLALGKTQGCRLIADDTQGENISQSVMIARVAFTDNPEGAQARDLLAVVWNEAAELVNASPESYRALLAAKANLSDAVAAMYPICTYPQTERPTAEMVNPVLAWMDDKGYLPQHVIYDASTGEFTGR